MPQPVRKSAAPVKKGVAKKGATAAPTVLKRTAGAPPPKPPQIVPIGTGTGEYPRILFYGPPGSFKTLLTDTAPNALMLEADRGDVSAFRMGSTNEKWPIDDWEDATDALSWLYQGGYKHYDWVSLDTISMFQESGLFNIMDDLVADPTKQHRKVWAPDKGEYGQNMSRLNRYIRDLVRLPVPIICTAHIQEEDDHTGVSQFMPMVQGKNMPGKICSYFDLIGHMSIRVIDGAEHPVFSTLKEEKYYTKDRFMVIGRMVDPTIPKILERMNTKPQQVAKKAVAKKAIAKKAAAPRRG
jgi:DNA polymerase III delta prime subunit